MPQASRRDFLKKDYKKVHYFLIPQSTHFVRSQLPLQGSLNNPSVICAIASLEKGGGLPQASRRDFLKKDYKKVHYFLIPQSVRVAHSQLLTGARPLCHFVTFPHTVGNHPLQGSLLNPSVYSLRSQTATDGRESPLSLRDISSHRGESPFTREPE